MSLIYMTHSGVVGTVQTTAEAFADIWSGKGWTEVDAPADSPGVQDVITQGSPDDGDVPIYDASTGRYVASPPAAASLPAGGTNGQVLTKSGGSVVWADGTPGPAGDPGKPGQNGQDGTGGTAQIGRWG
jgi:hypothetical protein